MLKLWNLTLIILTFGLTLFGTFLTRSGIIGSVHAFSQGSVGQFFLAFLALVLLGSFSPARVALRPPARPGPARLGGLARVGLPAQQCPAPRRHLHRLLRHRLSAAVRGGARRQGRASARPSSTWSISPSSSALLFLMGVGPLIAWRRASADNLRRNFLKPVIAGIVAAGDPAAARHRQCAGPPVHGARGLRHRDHRARLLPRRPRPPAHRAADGSPRPAASS